jgi:hypothetical protein
MRLSAKERKADLIFWNISSLWDFLGGLCQILSKKNDGTNKIWRKNLVFKL